MSPCLSALNANGALEVHRCFKRHIHAKVHYLSFSVMALTGAIDQVGDAPCNLYWADEYLTFPSLRQI